MASMPGRVSTSAPTLGHNENHPLSMDTSGNTRMTLGTLLAGEDAENGVLRTMRAYEYETVAAGQTAQVLGATGAAGDVLSHLVLIVSTAATAATSILDGATSIQVFPNSPGGGVGAYTVPLNLTSVNGAWSITTGAGVAVIAVGMFS